MAGMVDFKNRKEIGMGKFLNNLRGRMYDLSPFFLLATTSFKELLGGLQGVIYTIAALYFTGFGLWGAINFLKTKDKEELKTPFIAIVIGGLAVLFVGIVFKALGLGSAVVDADFKLIN